MVSLRYHIVSVMAVFLALGVGIVMGSTVIDRGIVDVLNRRVDTVERSLRTLAESNRRQGEQLSLWARFADQGRDQLLDGRLRGVPVMLVAVTGVDRRPIDDLRHQLTVAEADLRGTLWLNRKLRLDAEGDTRALAAAMGVPAERPDAIRRSLVSRLARMLAGEPEGPDPLNGLRDAAFVDFEPGPALAGGGQDLTGVTSAGTRVVVISGAGAQVADDQLAVPLAEAIALDGSHLLAAESGRDTPGGRAVFVGLIRANSDVAGRVATLDNLESFVGQAAGILAIQELGVPRVGHFGVGPGAQRLLPAATDP